MIFLDEMAKKLEDNGLGTRGVDIFIDRLNDEVDHAILLTDRLTGTQRYDEIPHYRMTRFNIIVRGTRRNETIERNYKAAECLANQQEEQLGGILFKFVNPLEDPRTFPFSEGDYFETLVRLETRFVITDYGNYATN